MCGFVGIFDSRAGGEIDQKILEKMNDSLIHRGPDDKGYYTAPGIGLGYRRLSIIDLAGGQQPMFNEDRSVVAVYNGEIYNFRELTRELRGAGHRFRTAGDTEVIVHAWEEWGADCVKHFRGMFAFALWDLRKQALFLARDRLGIKPLFFASLPDGTVLFGSELKALLVHPGLERKLDPAAVEDYFAYGYVPDPRTIYQGVAKLAPAHHLTIQSRDHLPAPRRYWTVRFEPSFHGSETEACEELRDRLGEAVAAHLISEVPLGGFLSGGVDSSAIVSMMASRAAHSVKTFSIGFPQFGYDETRFADQVARRLGTCHSARQVTDDDWELVDHLSEVYDEPFADSSAIPTFRLCAEARRRVTVALSGDGGDEVFAGYRRYRWHQFGCQVRAGMPTSVRNRLFGLAGRAYPKLDWAPRVFRAKSILQELACDAAEAYYRSVSITTDELRSRLYSDGLKSALQGYSALSILRDHVGRADTEDELDRVQYIDMMSYLPGDILTKVDRASMANSLEVRVPFLDHEIVEWAARLPANLRLRNGIGKYILKKSMERDIPHDLVYRKKMGFTVPISRWLRDRPMEKLETALCNGPLADTGYFDMAFVARLLERHRSGLNDFSAMLWALLMFDSFLRRVHWR